MYTHSGIEIQNNIEKLQDTPIIKLENVRVSYSNKIAVNKESMSVYKGEIVALIGPSGAGKSTLLRCFNLLEIPSNGSLFFNGAEVPIPNPKKKPSKNIIKKITEHRRNVGMVFQLFNLFPHLTALENVMLAQCNVLGRSKEQAKERALKELKHVGLNEHINSKPGNCSGGQQQRIAIARALAMDPQVMLFDEPTSALDPELSIEVLNSMRVLADEGMTMVIVTHDIRFVEEIASRVVFMENGSIVHQTQSPNLFQNLTNERMKQFISILYKA